MNIKLHTPKSLKMGSGLSTLKQFLMSIVATSISIALTFGTAHVVDNYKKQKDKREMVMMLMYDMDQTMEAVNDCESEILAFYEAQVSLLANPDQFMAKQYDLYARKPRRTFSSQVSRPSALSAMFCLWRVCQNSIICGRSLRVVWLII